MSQSNGLLGYPDDARLLIINADDFGMSHAVNAAIMRGLKEGQVCSTSLMVPCPWALHAMKWLKDNPDVSFAIHLTVICDQPNVRWKPLISREKVPSLVDESGFCYSIQRMSEMIAQARLDELEVEFRAQIETVLATGLNPTHLDWHCLHNGGRTDVFDMTFGLAKEYGLALRVDRAMIEKVHKQGLPGGEFSLLDSYNLDTRDKTTQYAQLLRGLPVGLSEWAVHPGLDNAEMQALEPDSWQVRTTDYDFVMSAEAREIIQQEGIILLNYKPIQQVWQGKSS